MMTQRTRIYRMLEEAGESGCTNAQFLAAYLPRFSARIEELRQAGHHITTQRLTGSSWRYVLVSGSASTRSPASGQRMPRSAPVGAEPDATLFEAPAQSKTRSAITGEWMDDAA